MAPVPFNGTARKIAVVLIAVSVVGWVLYVAGFGYQNAKYPDIVPGYKTSSPELYPFYAASVIGPVAYIAAVVHALLWREISSAAGSVTAIISIMYFTALGWVLHAAGIFLYENRKVISDLPTDLIRPVQLQFAGTFIACLSWAGVLALWPWYSPGTRDN